MFGLSKKNNPNEFLDLVESNQGIIIKICRIYTRNKEDFEDLYQEILANAWQSFPRFKGNSKFSTWLYKVSLNIALTHFKKRDHSADSSILNHDNDNHHLLHKEDYDKKDFLEKAFLLPYLDGYSYEEISEIMGCTVTHTGVKINRIKNKLKELATKEDLKTANYGK